MNFSALELDDEVLAFWKDARSFFEEHVTDEVLDDERRSGGGFNEALHLAMGERGWVAPTWPISDGGADLDPLRARILALELERSGAPTILASTTLLPPVAIAAFASDELKHEVLPEVAAGRVRISLGYTEPDCGSDLAAVRTRAVRDGDEWVVNGQKMFTTGSQFCQYCFCLTRTDPELPKHKGLTVFLIPLDLPGVDIRPIGTIGGERTNFVHFDDVRVHDRYRLGEVNDGWAVVSAPLAAEHALGGAEGEEPSGGSAYAVTLARLIDHVVDWARAEHGPDGRPLIEDPRVQDRLARAALDLEVADVTPGPMGRVITSDVLIRDAADLLEIVGPLGLVPHGEPDAVIDGYPEYAYRFAPGTAIYGGSTDIHRNMIAQLFLGLPRSTPKG
jgi:alkylation response protein AidB-like acyl-CoA dehydrogenase